jgi:VWFA-related protein
MKIERSALMLALAFTLLATSLSVLAQESEPVLHKADTSNAPLSVKVKEVNLFAVVRDKKGDVVDTLDTKDFVVEQDGRAETITQLTRKTDVPLIIGLLADTGPGQRKVMADERKAGTDFVNRLRDNKDKAFVLHFDKEVELLQDVTGAHDKLDRAVDGISVGEQQGSGRDQTDPNRPRFYFGGSMLYDAVYLSANEVLKDVHGRKVIVLFSDGQDRESKTTLTRAIEAAQRADTVVYCVYVAGEQEQQQNPYPGGGRHGGGFLGGGYPGGGYPGGGGRRGGGQQPPRENRADGKKILQQIASETGGRMFELSKKVTVSDVYGMIGDELQHQYSLTYTPDKVEVGHHRLHLGTKNAELTVQTREGFYAD